MVLFAKIVNCHLLSTIFTKMLHLKCLICFFYFFVLQKQVLICLKTEYFHPSKHFNVVSMFLLGWYDVGMSDNVKSTLKQRCVYQRWNLLRWTKLSQHCPWRSWSGTSALSSYQFLLSTPKKRYFPYKYLLTPYKLFISDLQRSCEKWYCFIHCHLR